MNIEESKFRKRLVLVLLLLSQVPFLILFFDNQVVNNFLYKFANISGFIGSVFLIWQFVLGVRGVSKWLSSDYDWVIKIHTFLGINGALLILIHPILESMVYKSEIRFLFLPNFSTEFNTYLSYGKIAFILFLFIWITSGLARKLLKYRVWLYIHYLSYPMLFFVLLHPLKIGSFLQQLTWVYYYWIFLCLLAVIFIFLKILDIFNITNLRCEVVSVEKFPGDTFTLKYKLPKNFNLKIASGQYFYIKNKFISEAHPFSILENLEESQEIIFGIKALGKYSSELAQTKVGDVHYLDGPFGEFTYEGQNSEPKIILAGGIGVTPFYELVLNYGNESTYMFYANKNLDTALYRSKFKKLLKNNYFDFILENSSESKNVFSEVITSNRIKDLLKNENLNNFRFFICGSPGFTNAMINCILELAVSRTQIFIEEFEY